MTGGLVPQITTGLQLESELEKGNFREVRVREVADTSPTTGRKAAVEVLKAVNLYGNVSRPDGATDPDVIMVKQAEKWARQEMEKEPPSANPLETLLTAESCLSSFKQ